MASSLNTLYEWHILQSIGSGVLGRLARCKPTGNEGAIRFNYDFANDNNLEFLETELRYVFSHKQVSADYGTQFPELQDSLTKLCDFLETAVNLSLIASQNTGAKPRVPYPNLQALLHYLDHEAGEDQRCDLDLVHGPNPTIFKISQPLEVKKALSAAESCNELIIQPRDSSSGNPGPSFPSSQAVPSIGPLREQGDQVLRALLAKFSRCTATHEVLLHLAQLPELAQPLSVVNMFLPYCSDLGPGRWQEAQCLPFKDQFSIREVQSLCGDLQRFDRHKIFSLVIKSRGVFSVGEPTPSALYSSPTSLQPLRTHIERGAFLRDDRTQTRPPDFFTPAQKHAIALRLARCLVDFFDSTSASPAWSLGKVYLAQAPGRKAEESEIYVTFEFGKQTSLDALVKIGNTVLLDFARLLLEINNGSEIKLSDSDRDPIYNWADLCVQLKDAERHGDGMYLSAIKGCLYVHCDIRGGEDLQALLREHFYGQVVAPLEAAVSPPSSQAARTARAGRGTPALHEVVDRSTDKTRKRMAIFRASEVTLRGGDTVSDIVHRIISKHTTDQEETASKPVVQDITDLFATKTRIKTTGRGTALIMFPGPVPEPFQHVMRGKTAKLLADTTGRSTISMEVDAKFIGMTQLHGLPPDAKHKADVVAIHGLNGHPYGSWLSKSDSPQMWLKDFLPEDAPNCRIFIYGYESNIFSEPTHPRFELAEQADKLIQALDGIRGVEKLKKKPIIFIAHSFGGLVLAKALVKACTGPSKKPLYNATVGLFLLACPLRGFHVQDILAAMEADQQEAQDCITENKAKALVQRLGEGNFRNELDSLPDILQGKRVYTFVEQRQTPMVVNEKGILRRGGEPVMAAGPHTVILGLGSDMEEVISADKDHSSIAKFDLRSDETYQNIKRRIQSLVIPDSAPQRPFKSFFLRPFNRKEKGDN